MPVHRKCFRHTLEPQLPVPSMDYEGWLSGCMEIYNGYPDECREKQKIKKYMTEIAEWHGRNKPI